MMYSIRQTTQGAQTVAVIRCFLESIITPQTIGGNGFNKILPVLEEGFPAEPSREAVGADHWPTAKASSAQIGEAQQ